MNRLNFSKVSGKGKPNEYNLSSVINAKINVNSSYFSTIKLTNPHGYKLKIMEIFSSDDDLHLELTTNLATDIWVLN
jgi:hypothetical protein